jgi:hypothetical protein
LAELWGRLQERILIKAKMLKKYVSTYQLLKAQETII